MLPCSGKYLAIPQEADPLCDNVPPIVGGYLGVHLSTIVLIVVRHVDVACMCSEVSDFCFILNNNASQLVDLPPRCGKVLFSNGSVVSDGGH